MEGGLQIYADDLNSREKAQNAQKRNREWTRISRTNLLEQI
jgi:hypothetical protein